jgi:hypothetical protein
MNDVTLGQVMNWMALFVFWASVINLLLPPLEWFDGFPRFYKAYRVALLIVTHYSSLNFRAALWSKFIDVQDATKPPQKSDSAAAGK